MNRFFCFIHGLLVLSLFLTAINLQSAELETETYLSIVDRLYQQGECSAALLMHRNFISPYDIEKCTPKTQALYHFLQGKCFMGLYEFEQAEVCFAKSLNIERHNIEVLMWASRCKMGLNNYAASIAILDIALDISKLHPCLLSKRALVYARLEKFPLAHADIVAAEKSVDISMAEKLVHRREVELNKAYVFMEEGKWHEAETIFVSLMQMFEKEKNGFKDVWGEDRSVEIYAGLARINLDHSFKYDSALEYINKAIHIAPKNGLLYLGRARIYSKLNKIDKAITDLDRAAELASGLKKVVKDRKTAIQRQPAPIFRFDGFPL